MDVYGAYLDELAELGRGGVRAWSGTVQTVMSTQLGLYSVLARASLSALDYSAQANRTWLDGVASSVQVQREVTDKLLAAGFGLAVSALPEAER